MCSHINFAIRSLSSDIQLLSEFVCGHEIWQWQMFDYRTKYQINLSIFQGVILCFLKTIVNSFTLKIHTMYGYIWYTNTVCVYYLPVFYLKKIHTKTTFLNKLVWNQQICSVFFWSWGCAVAVLLIHPPWLYTERIYEERKEYRRTHGTLSRFLALCVGSYYQIPSISINRHVESKVPRSFGNLL